MRTYSQVDTFSHAWVYSKKSTWLVLLKAFQLIIDMPTKVHICIENEFKKIAL